MASGMLRAWVAFYIPALLSACSWPAAPFEDLDRWIAEESARLQPQLDTLPSVRPLLRVRFDPAVAEPSPFDPRRLLPGSAAAASSTAALEAELNRKREPLEAFAFDELLLKGILYNRNQSWALIEAPTGEIFRITVGNYLGRDLGRVVAIEPETAQVVVLERIRLDTGAWLERTRVLALAGEPR